MTADCYMCATVEYGQALSSGNISDATPRICLHSTEPDSRVIHAPSFTKENLLPTRTQGFSMTKKRRYYFLPTALPPQSGGKETCSCRAALRWTKIREHGCHMQRFLQKAA